MYKQCATEQSAKRQRQLEQGLQKLMLKMHYDEISVSYLCEEMGIPRKSFYRYFSGKDGALYSLIDHALMDFDIASMQKADIEIHEAQRYMEEVFGYWMQCKPLLDALERSGLSGVLIQRAITYSRELDSLPRFMIIADKQLREYGTMYAVVGLMTMLVQWHHDGFQPGVEQMAGLVIRLMSEPLFDSKAEQ